ncbi:D-amino-acid oxidase [Amycolatopsis sp. NBRC 101858]|uniref:NAD(P)/FAD-dependent oxidoreductase n=1 Tax=Amycolatopsis sp. NBRC 101858 TaxID=3032200 RepID=UPI0024A04845|nr:FAD-dependent oxidoreductase [Amycolatopsis sp. NBRC 101858]GLY43219.1 D-amino-acid oxidase [Amycolatopsis sp. NBRC 101858]
MKVIVAGAGVLGTAVARALAVAGQDVLLLDRGRPGAGTTSTTFAWTNANRKLDPAYHRLNVAGMAEHSDLARQLPGAAAYFPSGALHWANSASAPWLTDNVDRLRALGYPVRWVERDEATRIAGALRIPLDALSFAHFPSEGYVLPDRLLGNLLADAERHGATFATGEVTGVDDGPGGVSVTLAGGEVRTADRVVLATGRWSERLAADAGIALPMLAGVERGSPAVGLLGYVRAPGIALRCVVHSPGLNLRPAAGGHTVVQALDLNAGVDPADPPSPDGPIAREIARRLSAVLPEPAPAPDIDLRVGFRSLPADGHTIAGFGSPRVYCLVSHSGVTLGPLLGRLAATELVTGRGQDLLDAFRPARFAGGPRTDFAADQHATRLGEQ